MSIKEFDEDIPPLCPECEKPCEFLCQWCGKGIHSPDEEYNKDIDACNQCVEDGVEG